MNSLKLKFAVFSAGASVMLVEILGSRIMAPYFGSSTYVWSTVIGVILASLSAGYYVGGRLADHKPSSSRLSKILLACSLSVFMIPLVKNYVLYETFNYGVGVGSILASLILLVAPGFLLGMVPPYAIKLSAKKIGTIGTTAGELYALSTIGSILGTISAGFLLIPYVNISRVFFCASLILLIAAIPLISKSKRVILQLLSLLIIFFMLTYTPPYLGGRKLLHLEYTPYNRILVEEFFNQYTNDENRYLFLNEAISGGISLSSGYSSFGYTYYFEIPFLINPHIQDILVAGEGTGVGPRQIHANHPNVHITISEIDPRVHQVAKEYFMLRENEKMRVKFGDLRVLVRKGEHRYDYVVFDIFSGYYSIPHYLLTREFFSDLKKVMDSDGIVLLNIISSVEGPKSIILQSVVKTLNTEFDHIQIYPIGYNRTHTQNVIIIASNTPLPTKEVLYARANDTMVIKKTQILAMLNNRIDNLSTDQGLILTDEFAPVDYLYLTLIDEKMPLGY